MATIGRIIHFDIDLALPLKQVHAAPMTEGDRLADVIEITLNRRGEPVTLSGLTAAAYVELSGQSGVTVRNPGTVSGGKINIPLQAECYSVPGDVKITVTLTAGRETRSVLVLTGYVGRNGTGVIIDPTGTVPSYEDIARIYAELEASMQEANAATSAANSAASNANSKASAANTAARTANAAAAKINGMTVSATGLAAGSAPTAAVSETGGHKHIAFGIPKGDTGATPNLTIGTVTTGSPADSAAASLTGTTKNPVLNLTIPQGVPGTGFGTVTSVNGARPDAAGNVRVGLPHNLLGNSDFTNPVNQRGQKSYVGPSDTIDRWTASNAMTKIEIVSGGVTFSSTGDGNAYAYQRVDGLAGKTITAAVCWTGGTIYTVTAQMPSVAPDEIQSLANADLSIVGGKLTLACEAQSLTLRFQLTIPAGKRLTLAWAALYEGEYTTATLPRYASKGYLAELAECLRYYRRWAKYEKAGIAVATSANLATGYVFMPEMRVTPTVEFSQMTLGSDARPITEITINTVSNNLMELSISTSAELTVREVYSIRAAADGYLELSARL